MAAHNIHSEPQQMSFVFYFTSTILHVKYTKLQNRPNFMCAAFQPLCKLPKSMLTNEIILCLVRFGFGRNKLMQLLIRSRKSGGRTVRSLLNVKLI